MAAFKVLSTKKTEPAFIKEAGENNIELIVKEFISITSITSQEKYEEVLKWILNDKAHIVVTSANAAKILCEYLNFDDFYEVDEWKFFCMAGKTKDTLINNYSRGVNIIDTAQSSSSLAEKIIEKNIKEVVFFCGDKRREELPELLHAKGVKVNEVILYQTKETPIKIEEDLDGILFYSPSGVDSFISANTFHSKTKVFAIGNTTGDALKKVTGKNIYISDEASTESIIKKMIECLSPDL